MAKLELLWKCLHGKHGKHGFKWTCVARNRIFWSENISIAVAKDIGSFNEEVIGKCHVIEALGINPGINYVAAIMNFDRDRIRHTVEELDQFVNKVNRKV